MSHSSYLNAVFEREQQDKVIRQIRQLIKDKNIKFDGFIVTGVSGVTMGAVLSRLLRKELVVVRKNNSTHASYKVENYKHNKRYIFLDDLIATGETYNRVIDEFENVYNQTSYFRRNKSNVIGAIIYDGISKLTGYGVKYITKRKLNVIYNSNL